MEPQGRANTRLRYRFASLEQGRAHIRQVESRSLFFYRDDKLRLLPYAPVCLEWSFEDSIPSRVLHGWVMGSIEGSGTWVELLDIRPVRELLPADWTRRTRRMGCDVLVEVRTEERIATGRMLDLSEGGARMGAIAGLRPQERVEIRLLSPDRLTFHDLSYGYVAWTCGEEMGVQFDRLDAVGRSAVRRLVGETEALWARAWEGVHPSFCCNGKGVAEPEPPRLKNRDEPVTGKIAL
jgi:hypothetical protein